MQGDARGAAPPPDGWYPDPSGAAQWRRWDGTSWGSATLPYGPPPPDASSLLVERGAWLFLRTIAPWGLIAPALLALAMAADSATLAPLRHFLRQWWEADLHHRPLPQVPATGTSSGAVSVTFFVVWLVTIVGIGAWLRFVLASSRVAAAATYPRRQGPTWTCLSIFIPFVGPAVAASASRAWLPQGHEARQALSFGWGLVALGELLVLAVSGGLAHHVVARRGLVRGRGVRRVLAGGRRRAADRASRRSPRTTPRSACVAHRRPRRLAGSRRRAQQRSGSRWATNNGVPSAGSSAVGGQRGPRRLLPQRARQGRQRPTYREKTSFKPFGPVDNGPQLLYGLDYRTAAWRGDEENPFHTEVRLLAVGRARPPGDALLHGPAGLDDHRGGLGGAERHLVPPRGGPRVDDLRDPVQQVPRPVRAHDALRRHRSPSRATTFHYDETTTVEHSRSRDLILHTDRNTLTRVSTGS